MYRAIHPLTQEERLERSAKWPIYIIRIYLAVRRANCTNKTRLQTLDFARRWFHAWVWNYAELPWSEK